MSRNESASGALLQVLKDRGPMLAGELARTVVDATGIPESTVRKSIERARKSRKIKSTDPVTFPRSYLCYLDSHKGRPYSAALRDALELRPPLARTYKTLLSNRGYLTHGQIAKAAVCIGDDDDAKPGGRTTPAEIAQQLFAVEAIEPVVGEDGLFRIAPQLGRPGCHKNAFVKRLETEQLLLGDIREWLTHCYLFSPEAHSLRPDARHATEFNQSQWDLKGPAYVGPLSSLKANRRLTTNGDFLAADICSFRTFTTVDAEAMIEKTQSINHRWKTISLTPLAIAAGFSTDAWNALRRAGIAAIKLNDIFGRNIDRILELFWKALDVELGSASSIDDIESALSAASTTDTSEGLIGNLKGAMFELIVALVFRGLGYDVVLQKRVQKPDEAIDLEVDVVAIKGESECLLIECKGRHKDYLEKASDVKRHFRDRCKAAADSYGWNVTERYEVVNAIYMTRYCQELCAGG